MMCRPSNTETCAATSGTIPLRLCVRRDFRPSPSKGARRPKPVFPVYSSIDMSNYAGETTASAPTAGDTIHHTHTYTDTHACEQLV